LSFFLKNGETNRIPAEVEEVSTLNGLLTHQYRLEISVAERTKQASGVAYSPTQQSSDADCFSPSNKVSFLLHGPRPVLTHQILLSPLNEHHQFLVRSERSAAAAAIGREERVCRIQQAEGGVSGGPENMSGNGAKKVVDAAVKAGRTIIDWDGMAKLLVTDEARKEFAALRRAFDDVNHQLQTKFSQVSDLAFLLLPPWADLT
jgi:hypothetical protein